MNAIRDQAEPQQRALAAVFERLRARLDGGDAPHDAPLPDTAIALEQAFGLTPFERDLILLAAGVELDAALAQRVAAQHPDGRAAVTFALGLAVLEAPHWSALSPARPLRRWLLLEPTPGEPLTTAALRLDQRILFYLLGVEAEDPRLAGLLRTIPEPTRLTQREAEAVSLVGARWLSSGGAVPPVVEITGPAERLAAAMASLARLRLLALDAADIPEPAAERVALARLCERELALAGAALLVVAEGPAPRRLALFAEEMASPLLLGLEAPLPLPSRPRLPLTPPPADASEREALWRLALGPAADRMAPELAAVAERFALDGAAVATIAGNLAILPPAEAARRLWPEARALARQPLDALAERLDPRAEWDDLVVPAPVRQGLEEIRLHVAQAARLHGTWGFAARGRAMGLAALFAGPSGTGKTMAAEVLARSLDLDLYRIDLSQTVSKFIGETEKNLKRIFDAGEASGAILLFDEADALFGKRSEVKDSHDRYANIEVSYLLQRMEAYAGLAILTTNQRAALDPAFRRRLRFVLGFPFPDAVLREALWRGAFPAATPVADLDYPRLAQLTLAGGHIRNLALSAAHLAMAAGTPVGMAQLKQAALAEYAKLEQPLTSSELEGWP
ncbi:ATP-binding protein [Humitalea sp. 24SJ18S-53]|uniref:ATP-binding protein n=1 Tax=Humitalea sp. 24SJ18S-53 TaxID=3422307 RepID=UPI003D66DEB6